MRPVDPQDTLFFLSHVPTDAAIFYLGSYSRVNGNFRGMPYYKNNISSKVRECASSLVYLRCICVPSVCTGVGQRVSRRRGLITSIARVRGGGSHVTSITSATSVTSVVSVT